MNLADRTGVIAVCGGGFGSMMGWGFGWMRVWPVLMLIGLVLLGVVAYALLRGGRESSPGRVTARDILDGRFARGEIDGEEYRQRVSGLL